MTKEEIIMQLMKLDIDFEITYEHDDGMHVLIKFDEEEERIKKVYNTKKLGLAIDGFAE